MPNASKSGSGGSLTTGDQIDLMVELTAGQSIGFFISSNGWDSSQGYGYQKASTSWQPFYTLTSLNPDEGLGQRYHVVFSDTRSEGTDDSGFFAYGFEDIKTTGGDKDYNDLIFSVEVTPLSAVKGYDDAVVLPSVSEQVESKTGVLAFEDNWPLNGDYDFNDAVISYVITKTHDADNNNETIQSLVFDYQIEAIGAAFHNGLALRVPGLTEEMIDSVILTKTLDGETQTITVDSLVTTKVGGVGTVSYSYPLIKDSDVGDTYASFTISEDLFEELSTFDSEGWVYDTETCMYKTTSGSGGCPEGTTSASIKLTINIISEAMDADVIGEMPFDHYLFGTHKNDWYRYSRKADEDWFTAWKSYFTSSDAAVGPGPGKYLEIHLKGFEAGTAVFEEDFTISDYTGAVEVDAQNYSVGNPFISSETERNGQLTGNLPWVIDFPASWQHPKELTDISEAYPDFLNWVEDNDSNTDWYETNIDESMLYIETE